MRQLMKLKATLSRAITMIVLIGSTSVFAHETPVNDYPTAVKADYVFGCMKTNGENRQILERCSCSIDYIAERMPYEEYVKVETIMRTTLDNGTRGSMMRDLKWASDLLDKFKKVQLKSDVECF